MIWGQNRTQGFTGFHFAAGAGMPFLKVYLEFESEVVDVLDGDGRSPLSFAAINGKESVAQLLIEKGANFELRDKCGMAPLSCAAYRGREDVVKVLLRSGAQIDAESGSTTGMTALAYAAYSGREKVVKLPLEKGAKLDQEDKWGRTPLYLAAENLYAPTLQLLLEKGANTEPRDDSGQAPLISAAYHGTRLSNNIIDYGADNGCKDHEDQAPLAEMAAVSKEEDIVALLLQHGADANAKDDSGNTPLWYAIKEGNDAITLLLIGNGADVNFVDNDGIPLHGWALANGKTLEIFRHLIEKGADVNFKYTSGGSLLLKAAQLDRERHCTSLFRKGCGCGNRRPTCFASRKGYIQPGE
jgi:ankyrin repeat protein